MGDMLEEIWALPLPVRVIPYGSFSPWYGPPVISVPIADITVPARKKTLKNVGSLKVSIKKHGLRQPIQVTTNRILIDGYRRLRSCKELGWAHIDVVNPDRRNSKPLPKKRRGRPPRAKSPR